MEETIVSYCEYNSQALYLLEGQDFAGTRRLQQQTQWRGVAENMGECKAMEAMEQATRAVDPSPVFRGGPLMRVGGWLWNAAAPALVWLTWTESDREFVWVLIALGYAWGWHCWPRAIHFGNDAIEQRNKFGFTKRIRYEDVISMSYVSEDETDKIVVSGPDSEIEHTDFHADRYAFIAAIQERTGKKVESPW